MNKKKWTAPQIIYNTFEANEYISVCGTASDTEGKQFQFIIDKNQNNGTIETAWNRTAIPGNDPTKLTDANFSNPHQILMGSFYRIVDGKPVSDSTSNAKDVHWEQENWGPLECAEKSTTAGPWGYHYHVIGATTNHS